VTRWVFPEKENAVLKGKVVRKHSDLSYQHTVEKVGQHIQCSLTPCIELYQDGIGFEASWPLNYDGSIQGYLNGVFRVKKIMDICLAKNVFKDFWAFCLGSTFLFALLPLAADRNVQRGNRQCCS